MKSCANESYNRTDTEATPDRQQCAVIVQSSNTLVCIQHREAVTTSLKVGEVFGKRHYNVVSAIRKMISEMPVRGRLIFKESSYLNDQNKQQPMYEMTRDGFSLLAMGFTGEKALQFKIRFLDAFNRMEKTLLQQYDPSWQQQNLEGKKVRRGETDILRVFVDYATSQGSNNPERYYTNITAMTYKALALEPEASAKRFRDTLNTMQSTFLAAAECVALLAVVDGMQQQLPYKEIYTLAKERVTSYAATLPPLHLSICS